MGLSGVEAPATSRPIGGPSVTTPSEESYRESLDWSAHVSRNEQEEINTDADNLQRFPLCICGDPNCAIPYGTCHCGCEKTTSLMKLSSLERGIPHLVPRKYSSGHYGRIKPIIETGPTFKIDGIYCRLIPLSGGQEKMYAIVEDADYLFLMKWRWYAWFNQDTRSWYAVTNMRRDRSPKQLRMNRIVLGLTFGDRLFADHANGVTLDNRRSNLRPLNRSQNGMNQRKQINSASPYKGISRRKDTDRWVATITINRKMICLGYFKTPELARDAYREAAKKYFGEFARFE
jgi:hypothetical protein